MQPPVLVLEMSRGLVLWLVALHLLAGVAVSISPIPWVLRLLLLLGVAGSLVGSLRRERARDGLRLEPLTLTTWRLGHDRATEEWRLADASVSRWLVILRFRGPGRRRRVLPVAADAVPAEVHRRLRAALTSGGFGR